MKKKLLTRVNLMLGSVIFSLVGTAGCNMVKYGPEPMYGPAPYDSLQVLYGPAPIEQVEDTTANNIIAQPNE
ncbi:MAG: hypothetical protein IK073_05185 [Paludibacteraceae bacterium]|nr:hypothetical protein [Paludibacteraceae bacterium]